jgi:membrane protein
MAETFGIYLGKESPWFRLWRLLKMAGEGAFHNNCFGIAKAVAYSMLLSFFPVLTTLAALLVQARADEVSRTITSFLYEVVPPGTESVVRNLFVVHGQRPRMLLVVAVVLSTAAASGAMMSLMEGFREIYSVPSRRPFLRERSMAILLVFVAVVPAWAASAVIVLGSHAEGLVVSWLGLLPQGQELQGWVSLAGEILRYAVAFCTFVLVMSLVYHLAPNRKQSFRLVLPGALLVTVLWLVATIAFGWYVRHIAHYNVLYGSAGAGLALLVWMYVLAVLTLYGCEFNAARERLLVAHPVPMTPQSPPAPH